MRCALVAGRHKKKAFIPAVIWHCYCGCTTHGDITSVSLLFFHNASLKELTKRHAQLLHYVLLCFMRCKLLIPEGERHHYSTRPMASTSSLDSTIVISLASGMCWRSGMYR